jgi:hypothetical protein
VCVVRVSVHAGWHTRHYGCPWHMSLCLCVAHVTLSSWHMPLCLCLPPHSLLHRPRLTLPAPCVHPAGVVRGSHSLSPPPPPPPSQARPLGVSMAKITAEIPPADDADVAGTHSQKYSIARMRFFQIILVRRSQAHILTLSQKYSLIDVMSQLV